MRERIKMNRFLNMLMVVALLASIFAQPIYGATEVASEIRSQASEVISEEEASEVVSEEEASEVISEEEVSEVISEEEASEVVSEEEASEVVSKEFTTLTDLSNMTSEELEAYFDDETNEVLFIDTSNYKLPKEFKYVVTSVKSDYSLSYFNSSMWGEWSVYKIGGKFVFCVEPGANTLTTASSTTESGSIYHQYSRATKDYIGMVISSTLQHYSDTGNIDFIFAGQLLIWEYLSDHEIDLLTEMYGTYNAHAESGYLPEVNKIDADLEEWTTLPSFLGSQANPKKHTLIYNASSDNFSIILKDTNGVWDSKFANYGDFGNFTVTNPSGANNVKITTNVENTSYTSSKKYSWESYASGSAEFYDAGQDLVYIGANPVVGAMKFNTEEKPLGGFKVKKVDGETNETLSGAEFTFYDDSNNKIETYTTNSNGIINTGKTLDVGHYTLKETKAPTGYKLSNVEHSITITADTIRDYTSKPFKNNIYKGGFKIKKVDSETGVALEGAKYTLYDSEGSKVDTYMTNSAGIISSGKKLRPGSYTLKETRAPEGYVKSNTVHNVTIKADEVTDLTSTPYKNDIIRGGFELTKLGEIFQLDPEELVGVEFTVTSSTYPEFNKVYTTDDNGQIITADNELKYGDYHIQETKAPSKYVIDFEQDFSISKDGVIVMLNGGEDIVNNLYENKIHGLKVAENFDNNDGEMHPLAGTAFGIYEELGTPNGAVDRQDHLIDLQVTDENGEFTSIELPEGSYVLKEIEPTEGYNLNETNYPFEIKNDGTLENHSTIDMGTIENEVITAKAQLIKVGSKLCDKSTAKPNRVKDCQTLLPDVSFAVYQDLNNNGVFDKQESNPVDVMITDNEGLAVSEDLKFGHYFVKEINNPADNYFINDNVFEFTISEQDEMVMINNGVAIENVEKLGNIHITKSGNEIGNLDDEPIFLAGAEYTIYNAKGEVEDVLTTDSNGEATSVLLSFGDYTIQETKAPEGYVLDQTVYPFTIDQNNYDTGLEMEFIDELIKNEIHVKKTDFLTGEEIPGAHLQVVDVNTNEVVEEWISTEEEHVFDLTYGNYMLIETIAPEGYQKLSQGIEIEVTENGVVQQLVVENKPIPEVAVTGGNNILYLSIGGLLVSLAGLVIFKKKTKLSKNS